MSDSNQDEKQLQEILERHDRELTRFALGRKKVQDEEPASDMFFKGLGGLALLVILFTGMIYGGMYLFEFLGID